MSNRANEKIRIVLDKILYEYSLGAESDLHLELRVEDILESTGLSKSQFLKVIDNLRESKLIRRHDLWKSSEDTMTIRHQHPLLTDFNMCVLELSADFRHKAEIYLKELNRTNSTQNVLAIHLDQSGNLWHSDKDSFCYGMNKNKARYKLCRYLFEYNDGSYIPTENIAESLGKNKKNIMSEIGKLRTNFLTKLQLDDAIQSDTGSGYRLNPAYKTFLDK